MISWINGKIIDIWMTTSRVGVVLSCNGIGYEIQLLPRFLNSIQSKASLTLWTHQLNRDDGVILFGFAEKLERDLFRKLISTSGIGPQTAMSLLEQHLYNQLVSAIVNKDIGKLTSASGVGKRTAERLVVELKNKLSEFKQFPNDIEEISGLEWQPLLIETEIAEELLITLESLEYEEIEIKKAINTVLLNLSSEDSTNDITTKIDKKVDFDSLLKATLQVLSQNLTSLGT